MDRIQTTEAQGRVADAPSGHWVYRLLPRAVWPYAQLARWDRPIGWQLLMWPCLWSLTLAAAATAGFRPPLQERQSLRHRIGEIERRSFDDSILDRNTNTSSQITHLQRITEALDTWHDWATGTRVPVGDLRDTYTTLRFGLEHDWLHDDPRSQLANTLQSWADDGNLQLTTIRPAPGLPERQLGIEMA